MTASDYHPDGNRHGPCLCELQEESTSSYPEGTAAERLSDPQSRWQCWMDQLNNTLDLPVQLSNTAKDLLATWQR